MKLSTLALGAAGGYAVARLIEAKAVNLPLDTAFALSNLLKPISALRAALPTVTASNVIDVTPVPATAVSGNFDY